MLDNFIDFLSAQKRFSEHTAIAYRKDLEQFLEFADISNEDELKEVNARLIRGWMVELMEKDYLPQSKAFYPKNILQMVKKGVCHLRKPNEAR